MRLLAALGAMLFLYLAVIPAGLVYSTIDSACQGAGCNTPFFARVGLVTLYSACFVAIFGTATLFARHALAGSIETQDRLVSGLRVSAAVIGFTLFVLFAIATPLGGVIALVPAIAGYVLISRCAPDAGGNGKTNGHGHGVNGRIRGDRIVRPRRP